MYDGYSESDPLLAHHCGEGPIPPIETTNGALLVKFVTDLSVATRGFIANWTGDK